MKTTMKTGKRPGHSLALGIAFVGFTTQFGGGFASGAAMYQYFINYGVWALVMPFLAQFLLSLFYWYGMRYAYRNKTFDYRSFSDRFYGRFKGLFSNLYELEYLLMVCMAPAVAFATGGATLSALTGLPYMVSTLIIGGFIFAIVLFGTDIVRKCSSILSILIIAGMVVVLVPNIIVKWDSIMATIRNMSSGVMPVGSTESGSFGSALWRACIYGIFQITAVGLMYQHTRELPNEKEVGRSMFYMFIVDAVIMELAVFGLLAVANLPELATSSVPMLLLVQTGIGSKILTPIISVLIILGSVSTGVNMIAGLVERCMHQKESKKQIPHKKGILSLLFTALTFAVAQLGLIPLVKTGYSYIGYVTIFVIIIPFILHFIFHSVGKKAQEQNELREGEC